MNTIKNQISVIAGFAYSKKARMVLFLLTLVAFVLSAGAPDASGGIINACFFGPFK